MLAAFQVAQSAQNPKKCILTPHISLLIRLAMRPGTPAPTVYPMETNGMSAK